MASKGGLDLEQVVVCLSGMTIFELRREWQRVHRVQLPVRLSKDLLIRAITYKLQERAHGGLKKSDLRRLTKLCVLENDRVSNATAPAIALKPGTRLVREWRGTTYSVLVLDEGFEWNGQTYRSLSTIAKRITGAHWSGPRFFGLRPRSITAEDEGGYEEG